MSLSVESKQASEYSEARIQRYNTPLAKDLAVCQEKLVHGIADERAEEQRDADLWGVGRNVEGVCDVSCTVEATNMAWVPQETHPGRSDERDTIVGRATEGDIVKAR